MFSSLFNSAKEILENATSEQPANTQQPKPAQPAPQADAGGRQEAGGDLLSGILQAVGKSLSEGNQQATQQAPQPPPPSAGDGNQSAKSPQGFNIRPEDVAMITKGLGVLAQVVKDRTSAKGAEGGQAAKVDANAPAGQTAGNAEQGGGDFLSGLMNVVKDLSNTNKAAPQGTAQSGSQLSQEDIARITAGLGSLATTLKEKAWGSRVDDESVTKLDAQGGKVQVSSVVEKTTTAGADQPPSSGGDFLSGLMNVAKDVGKVLGEQNQTGSAANTSGNTTQQQGGSQLSQEDIARISSGLGSLVDMFKTKPVVKEHQEEQMTKVEAHTGPKPMSLLEKADAQAEQTLHEGPSVGHDFLSGLLNVAKDVGKVVEQNQHGTAATNPPGPTSNTTAQGGIQQLSQEDLAKLTLGLGSLIGAIQGKATDPSQEKTPAEEVKKAADEPVVDDVEEEIGKVVLPGYTGYKDASAVSKPKAT